MIFTLAMAHNSVFAFRFAKLRSRGCKSGIIEIAKGGEE
ncbi:hypothetical protein ES703_12926 [subsurface metagenome]